jgi:pimeloyl-ACP methyl ester carboxylesterase
LLLHGFPEFWWGSRRQIPALAAAGRRVVVPDLRGYNLSGKPRGIRAYGLDPLTDDLRGLIDDLGPEAADVVAHDWGGAAAIALDENGDPRPAYCLAEITAEGTGSISRSRPE